MADRMVKVKVFRFDPSVDGGPWYRTYEVPFEEGMTAMNALDYIYEHLDGSLAYYDHAACSLGVCGRCAGKVDGRPGLLCQLRLGGDATIEPLSRERVVKDLATERAAAG